MSTAIDFDQRWIDQALPKLHGALTELRWRRPFCTDDDVADLTRITTEVMADTESPAEDRILAWRTGRAEIIARAAVRLGVLGDNPHPDSAADRETLLLGVLEHAWHTAGHPDLWRWQRMSNFGGDPAVLTAFEQLIVESRVYANDGSSPTDMAEAAVSDFHGLPRFLWSL